MIWSIFKKYMVVWFYEDKEFQIKKSYPHFMVYRYVFWPSFGWGSNFQVV